jgi:hypothetical protein
LKPRSRGAPWPARSGSPPRRGARIETAISRCALAGEVLVAPLVERNGFAEGGHILDPVKRQCHRWSSEARLLPVFHFVASCMARPGVEGSAAPTRRTNSSSLTPQRLTTDSAHATPATAEGSAIHGGSVFP